MAYYRKEYKRRWPKRSRSRYYHSDESPVRNHRKNSSDDWKYKIVIVSPGKDAESELHSDPKKSQQFFFEEGFISPADYRLIRKRYACLMESYCGGDSNLIAMVTRGLNRAVFGTSDYRKLFGMAKNDPVSNLPGKYLFRLAKMLLVFCNLLESEAKEKGWTTVGAEEYLYLLKKMGVYDAAEIVILTKVVGVMFEGRQDIVKNISKGDELELVRNRNNEHDKNAIAVFFKDDQAGFLCRELAEKMAPLMDKGDEFLCRVSDVLKNNDGSSYSVLVEIRRTGNIDDIPEGLYDLSSEKEESIGNTGFADADDYDDDDF